jgi:hypothetical protein
MKLYPAFACSNQGVPQKVRIAGVYQRRRRRRQYIDVEMYWSSGNMFPLS